MKCFCFQDSPRRAHSIAAQGGINAAKNYQNDGDSIYRLFYDTVKGGDFRAREANVYRLAQISVDIIDQCVAQGVPFAREYGGLLANRSFGGAQVSRTFYARGQTGQQLLLGAYQALEKEVARGGVTMFPRTEMLDLVVDRRAGPRHRGARPGDRRRSSPTPATRWCSAPAATATCSTSRPTPRAATSPPSGGRTSAGARVRQSLLHADPSRPAFRSSGDYQSKLTLMSESLRNDGRVWVPQQAGRHARAGRRSPRRERDYYLERRYPELRQPGAARHRVARGQGGLRRGPRCRAGRAGRLSRLRRRDPAAWASRRIRERYGNLFEMYQRITDENPYQVPMRIYPAVHYTMGGLWVDYNLMSTIPGLHVIGEANFSDHGANRLGASALMQGLADGYFILPDTIGDYLASAKLDEGGRRPPGVPRGRGGGGRADPAAARRSRASGPWTRSTASWASSCGTSAAWRAMRPACSEALRADSRSCARSSGAMSTCPGSGAELNQALEKAGRVADFLELGELMCRDALHREESCGGHFREEYQTEDGEALRDDERLRLRGRLGVRRAPTRPPCCTRSRSTFEYVHLAQRSYK